jgi:hypothetical protein
MTMHNETQLNELRNKIAHLRCQFVMARPDDPQRVLVARALLEAYHNAFDVLRQRLWHKRDQILMEGRYTGERQ